MMDRERSHSHKGRLGDNLLEKGTLDPDSLKRGLEIHRSSGKKLGETLVTLGLLTEDQLIQTLSKQLGYQTVRLDGEAINPEVLTLIPEHLARRHHVMPIDFNERALAVAMWDPLNYDCIRDLSFYSGYGIRPFLATREQIRAAIERQYSLNKPGRSVTHHLQDSSKGGGETPLEIHPEVSADELTHQSLPNEGEPAPIVRLANLIIGRGIEHQASDIHIEPGPECCLVRYRVDGLLREEMRLPRWVQGGLVSRIKILCRLDIAERRLPQDGAMRVRFSHREVDLRVSLIPTQFGEKAVIRILDQARAMIMLETLGLDPKDLNRVESLLRHRKGIILVTGPTGSGKSTTLYAMVNRLRSLTVNLTTVEDPIEYCIEGASQIQVNPDIGLTFAHCLRSVLRQDPDIIMIGEIRDRETADIAFRAAMTGHLVLSTLHTNDAAATISRLIDIGVPRYLVASQLIGIVAQRLIRLLCGRCKAHQAPSAEDCLALSIPRESLAAAHPMAGKGCPACRQTGYSGRTAIFEIMSLNPSLRNLIALSASEQAIRSAVRGAAMDGLLHAGLKKVKEGLSSLQELARVVESEESMQSFCPSCSSALNTDYLACPYCGTTISNRCRPCGKPIRPEWILCPYCGEGEGTAH